MHNLDRERKSGDYSPEQEREELIKQVNLGRKYQAAREVLGEIIARQRARIIQLLETSSSQTDNDAAGLVIYLRTLKLTENLLTTEIDKGEIAEKELIKDGSDD